MVRAKPAGEILTSVVCLCPRIADSGPYQVARVSAFSHRHKTIGHEHSDDCGPCQIKYGGFFINSAALG